MRQFAAWNKRSSWFKNTVGIASGAAIGHIANAVGLLIIVRIYTDDGLIAIASSFLFLITMLAPLATCRYEMAIPVAKDENEVRGIFSLCNSWLLLSTAVLTGILAIFSNGIFSFLNLAQLASYWWVLPIAFWGTGVYNTLTYLATREKAYKVIAITKGVRGAVMPAVAILWGVVSPSLLGLLLSPIAGSYAGIGRLASASRGRIFSYLAPGSFWDYTVRYKQYSVYGLPSTIASTIAFAFPTLIVIKLFGQVAGDSWALATRLITMPVMLIGSAIGQVFMGEMSGHAIDDSVLFKKSYGKIIRKTGKIAVVLAVFSIIIGFILPYLLGSKWGEAGILLIIFSVSIGMHIMISPASVVPILLGRMSAHFYLSVTRALLTGLGIYAAYAFGLGLIWAAILFTVCTVVSYGMHLIVYAKLVREYAPVAKAEAEPKA